MDTVSKFYPRDGARRFRLVTVTACCLLSAISAFAQNEGRRATGSVASPLAAPPGAVIPAAAPIPGTTLGGPALVPSSPGAPITTRPLATFLDRDEQIMLLRDEAHYRLQIPISARMNVTKGEVSLYYYNSNALLAGRSQIYVSWDQRIVGQAALAGENPGGRLITTLPPTMMEPGFHRLVLSAAQHYTLKCENPGAPELWTQVDSVASTVTLNYDLKPLNPRLSDLPDLIDPKLWTPPLLNIVTRAASAMQDIHLLWGALTVQKAAVYLKYVPLEVTHGDKLTPTGDQIVIGTRDEIRTLLTPAQADGIGESFLGVFPHPLNNKYFMLVISGSSNEGVSRAVQAFAATNFPLPPTPTMNITAADIPDIPVYQATGVAQPDKTYRFSQFDFQSGTIRGMNTGSFHVSVKMPPDLYTPERTPVTFRLHFAHGGRLREDSVFNIMLNGRFENVIYLNTASGSVYRDYSLDVPLRSFEPGENNLEFTPQMVPSQSDACEILQTENLLFTLFDDSKLEMPEAVHFVRLPDLRLFQRTGFPYLEAVDGSTCGVQVASHDSGAVAAAWMLMGKLAQINMMPMLHASVGFGPPPRDKQWIVVGLTPEIDRQILGAAPVQFGRDGQFPSIFASLPQGDETLSGSAVTLLNTLGINRHEPPAYSSPQLATVKGNVASETLGVVMQFKSPDALQENKSVLMAVAQDGNTLRNRVAQLVHNEFWGKLKGDTMVWEELPASVSASSLGATYYMGDTNPMVSMQHNFSLHPWMWVLTVFALVIIFALLTRRLLSRFYRRHHRPAVVIAKK